MTWKEAVGVIEKEIHIDVRHCTQEDVNRFAVALRMAIAILREQDAKYTNDFTNADYIRSMTDEELAKFLLEAICGAACFGEGVFPYHPCPQDQNCEKCGLNWLKRPYKEDT